MIGTNPTLRSFFFQAEDGIRDIGVTGVQTCALPISVVRLAVDTVQLLDRLDVSVPVRLLPVGDRGGDPVAHHLGVPGGAEFRGQPLQLRSEERRVGTECRFRWSPYHYKKK